MRIILIKAVILSLSFLFVFTLYDISTIGPKPNPYPVPIIKIDIKPLEPLKIIISEDEFSCLWKAIYTEARNQSFEGQKAIGHVIINRLFSGEYSSNVCNIVRQKNQFALAKKIEDKDAAFVAIKAANQTLQELDTIRGSLYFHHRDWRPEWTRKFKKVMTIGDHYFYRES